MKNKSIILLLIVMAITSFAGCESKKNASTSVYTKITSEEAKKMIDQNNDLIILDVRTEEEYNTGHIKNAILIPDNEIADKAEDTLSDKSVTILVYCRSGRRSALAAKELSELGYTNIYDFGGIIDWSYDIVTK